MSSIDSTQDIPGQFARSVRRRTRHGERDQAADARWVMPAFIALLAITATAYLWNLTASGDANSFYAAAVQAGTKSWKAFFFGSLDSSSFISVDKPPASLWVMALSGRIFGFSSFSMLAPQALEGVAAVGLLYGAVKRWFGPAAGLGAGAMFALTPVAALMFRFNNPDALLVLLLVAGAYCLVRAVEHAGTRWMLACGALLGFAFLAKMGQAFLVVPAFALTYVVAAPTSLRRRISQLAGGFGAMLVAGGWWVAIVALWPTGSRPFIDGSPDNNIFNLIFGYNGLSRIFGGGGPGGGAAPGGGGAVAITGGAGGGGQSFSGATGVLRLFNDLMGGQASWLLPAALVALLAGLWLRRAAPRTDRIRAALILWGGWLLVTAAIFSFSQGVIHTYYEVALAPAIGALVAIGAVLAFEHRTSLATRALVASVIALSGGWSYALLDRTPNWNPWLRALVLAATVLATAGTLAGPALLKSARRAGVVLVAVAAFACLAGPVAYAAQTISTAHTGSIPSAGPTLAGSGSPAGGLGFAGAPGRGGRPGPPGLPSGKSANGVAGNAFGAPGAPGNSTGGSLGGVPGPGAIAGGGGGPGGVTVSATLARSLETNAARFRWVAATDGSTSAASIELATGGEPVMAIGGFNDNGGELTLSQFERYVAAGDIHFYIASGNGGGGPGGLSSANSPSSEISSWVASHYKAQTIGGVTLYDLSR